MSVEAIRLPRRILVVQTVLALLALGITLVAAFAAIPLIKKKAVLEGEVAALEARKQELARSNDQAIALLNERAGPAIKDQITPRASASPVAGAKNAYLFRAWLSAPPDVKSRIARVEYTFDHPSFTRKTMPSARADEDFAVSYRGWGCLSLVTIQVFLKDGTSFPLYFDMCGALGTSWEH